jgi:hypothetical protein
VLRNCMDNIKPLIYVVQNKIHVDIWIVNNGNC